jgi:membrane-associated HD superfamily phosphohydrolase
MSLKLLKAGHVIGSQRIKQYFLSAAKEVKLINDSQKEDIKRLEEFKAAMEKLLASTSLGKKKEKQEDNILHYFHRIEKKFKKIKRKYETSLEDMFKEFITHKEEDYSAQAAHTTIMEKAIKQQIKEIWEAIIPISCPHCNAKNPGFRIDGYTKIFRKPISNKLLTQMKQSDRIKQGTTSSSRPSSRGRNDST